ncbi:MAG: hypothetical protein ACTSQO_01845 [Candidatus Helarchaeota archaeon]
MKNKILILFCIGRLFNILTFIGGWILEYGIDNYPIYGIFIMVLSIIFTIWGILGFKAYFDENFIGNVFDLIVFLIIAILGTICLFSSIVWGQIIIVIFGSILIISGSLITFFADIIVFSSVEG